MTSDFRYGWTEETPVGTITYTPKQEVVEQVVVDTYGIPDALRGWLDRRPEVLPRFGEVLAIVDEYDDLSTQADIAGHHSSWGRTSLANHLGAEGALRDLVHKFDGVYRLTSLGEQAAAVDWTGVKHTITDGRRR